MFAITIFLRAGPEADHPTELAKPTKQQRIPKGNSAHSSLPVAHPTTQGVGLDIQEE